MPMSEGAVEPKPVATGPAYIHLEALILLRFDFGLVLLTTFDPFDFGLQTCRGEADEEGRRYQDKKEGKGK